MVLHHVQRLTVKLMVYPTMKTLIFLLHSTHVLQLKMQSARFGVAWTVHQTLPRLLKEIETDGGVREAAALAALALARVLPCRFCRDSYAEFMRAARVHERRREAPRIVAREAQRRREPVRRAPWPTGGPLRPVFHVKHGAKCE